MYGYGYGYGRVTLQRATPLLDRFPGAAAAYSLRKLRTAYTGAAIRVRESATLTEADIGFTSSGALDTAALLAHTGANNGFSATWYDQSSTNNATQTNAAIQPQIVTTGTVILINGEPAIRWDGVSDLMLANRLLTTNEWAIFSVVRPNTIAAGFRTIISQHTGATDLGRTVPIQLIGSQITTFFNNGTSYTGTHSVAATTSQTLISSLATANDYYLSVNGVLEEVISGQALTPLNTQTRIGTIGFSNYFNGEIQELIVYNINQLPNRTAIESNINAHYNIYP